MPLLTPSCLFQSLGTSEHCSCLPQCIYFCVKHGDDSFQAHSCPFSPSELIVDLFSIAIRRSNRSPKCNDHSLRSVSKGSSNATRRAGMRVAIEPANASTKLAA